MKFNFDGVRRLCHSFLFAGQGFWHCVRREQNFRIHLVAAACAAALGFAVGLSRWEWALLVVTVAFMLAREMINTAVEALVDLASPEKHPLAKTAKDVAAAAVLVSAAASVAVGLLLFWRPEKLRALFAAVCSSPPKLLLIVMAAGLGLWFIFYAGENTKSK